MAESKDIAIDDSVPCEACDAGYRRAPDFIHYNERDSTWGVCRRYVVACERARGMAPCECGCGKIVEGGKLEAAHPEDYRYER